MKNLSSSNHDYELWVLLAQTRHAIFKVRRKELAQFNIPPMRSAVLSAILAIGDKATPAEISRLVFRESHSVSELISRMEKDGLVRKAKDFDRKNLVRVVLTEKGREACYQSNKRESIHKMMSSLSGEQRLQLRSCLKTLRRKALEELGLKNKITFPP